MPGGTSRPSAFAVFRLITSSYLVGACTGSETTTRVLASLTPREERILRMRFGIGMNKDHTLEAVVNSFR